MPGTSAPGAARDLEAETAELVARARAVAEELRPGAARTEELRRVPEENFERVIEAGLLGVIQSRRTGGRELSMRAHLDVVSAVAEGCSSTAWVLGVMHAHSWLMAHFPHRAQDEVYGDDPDAMISAVLAPRGKATKRADGTFLVEGFWPFGSGCQLSKWLILGAEVSDEKGGFLDLADFLVPTEDVEIRDDWHVAGLQGTGSCSLAAKDLEVPGHRSLSIPGLIGRDTPGMNEGYDGWLHRAEAVPVLALALCGGSIGLARAAVAAFRKSVSGKTVAYTEHVQAEWSATHVTLGAAASLADAGALLLYRAADDIDRLARAGERMPMETRGRMRMDCAQGVRFALEAADKLFISSGGAGLSLRNVLQQVSRDLHAVNMHGLLLHEASAEIYGRLLLGLEPNTIIV